MNKPKLPELVGLLLILSLCAAVLYLYYTTNEPANTTDLNMKGMDYEFSNLIYTIFPRQDLNQTTIIINSSYILNMTEEKGILTITIKK